MSVTLQDIANHANVSLPTASQILSPLSKRAGLFSEATRQRVRRAADELCYRPNSSARSMATGRFGAVTLVLSHHDNRSILPHSLLAGIEGSLASTDLHLMIARLPDQKLTDAGAMPKLMRELASDGLLINYNAHIPSRMIELVDQYRLPSVWINTKQTNACVYPDDERAGYELTKLLLENGHERIAFVDYTYGLRPKEPHYSNPDRRAGYRRAMREARLAPRIVCGAGNILRSERIEFSRQWIEAPDHPTGVVCYTHHESAAILATADRLGLSVPRDLAVVTVHDEPAHHYDISIPTAVLPEREIGSRAVTLLAAQIATKNTACESFCVPLSIVHADQVFPPGIVPRAARTGRDSRGASGA